MILPILAYSQDLANPVNIEFSLVSTDLTQKVVADVEVKQGWFIYSSTTAPGGPVATEMIFESIREEELGKLKEEGEMIKKFDEMFDLEVSKYKDRVRFTREVDPSIPQLEGYLYYMVCDDKRCLPPTEAKFSLSK